MVVMAFTNVWLSVNCISRRFLCACACVRVSANACVCLIVHLVGSVCTCATGTNVCVSESVSAYACACVSACVPSVVNALAGERKHARPGGPNEHTRG